MSEPQKLLRLRNVHRGREAHHVVHLTRLGGTVAGPALTLVG